CAWCARPDSGEFKDSLRAAARGRRAGSLKWPASRRSHRRPPPFAAVDGDCPVATDERWQNTEVPVNKSFLATIASLLILAGVALAQGPDSPSTPVPSLAPEPAGMPVVDGSVPFFAESSPTGCRVCSFDAEYVLWYFSTASESSPI